MKESDFKFAFQLTVGIILTVIGLIIACYCGAHTNSMKPLISAIMGIFGGVLLRNTHFIKQNKKS